MTRMLTIAFVSLLAGCATTAPRPAAASSAAPSAAVERTDKLTVEEVADLQSVSQVAISPDGKRIAYVLRTPRLPSEKPGGARSVIWVVDAKGGTSTQFTSAEHSSSSPAWHPDGESIAFVSTRGDDETRQVFRIGISGGEPTRLTEHDSGIRAFEWSADGKHIAFTADRIDTPAEDKEADEGRDEHLGDVHGTKRRLWTLEVATGLTRPVTEQDVHVERFRWFPDGKRFVIQASKRADVDATMMYSRLWTVPLTGGKATKLTETAGKLGSFEVSPDSSQIAFFGATDIHDPTAGVLYVVPAAGGTAKALTEDLEATGQWAHWTGKDALLAQFNEGTKTTFYSVTTGGKRKPAVNAGPVCSSPSISTKGRALACAGSTGKHPREVFAGNLRKLRRTTNSNPWLDGKLLGEQTVVRWKAADGLEIEGVLIKPVGYRKGQRYPLAILPHGGPEGVSSDGWNTRTGYPAQLFAERGYVVLLPNYRGSQGRGVAYGKADQKDLGGKEFEDVLAGIDHLVAEGLVDGNRVGMGGWSYGGYFSGLAATMHSERFKAAMVGAAITNWVSFTGTTEIEHENSLVHWNLWPYEHYDLAWSRSPLAHAKKSKTATLIVHGQSDSRVPPEQATELYRALRHFKVKTELVTYPREGHGLRERAHQIDFANRFLDWFDTHVKG